RQPEPPQRRALSRPRLPGPAADPRRRAGRRSPPRVRPPTGPRTHPVLLVRRPRPPASLAHGGHTGPPPSRHPHPAHPPARQPPPRYGEDVRAMPLAPRPGLLMAGDPLPNDLVGVHGTSAFVRQLVRGPRAAANLRRMRRWLDELESCLGQPALRPPRPVD